MRRSRLLSVALAFAAFATQACQGGGDGGGSTPPVTTPVASIDVSPPSVSIAVGQTAQLSATTKSAAGATLTGRTVTWSSSDQTIATVSTAGLVTAVRAGSATITATSEGIRKDVVVTVSAIAVATIDVSSTSLNVNVGQSTQLTATPKSATGAALADRQVTWSVVDQTIATVSASGLVVGVKAGSTTVTATSEGVHKDVTVTVTALPVATITIAPSPVSVNVGGSVQATATPKSADGTSLSGRTITWSIADQTIATISSSGSVTGVKPGSTTATATSEGISQNVTVNVSANPVASLSFIVNPSSGVAGAVISPSVQVRLLDSFGNVVPSSAAVSVSLTGGTSGATLDGTTTVNAVDGVATFSGLNVKRQGLGYRLVATLGSVQGTSNTFNVSFAAPAKITKLAGDAQQVVAGTAVPTAPAILVQDAYDNLVTSFIVSFVPVSGSGSIAQSTSVTNGSGIATSATWTVGPTMGPNLLTASVGSVSATFTANVTGAITPGIQFVVGGLASASTASVAAGQSINVPLTLDLSNRGSADLGAIQATIAWDPTKLTFASESVGDWQNSSVTINTADASSGVIRIAGYTTSATVNTFVLRNLRFTASGAAGSSTNITAAITAAGNAAGNSITTPTRPLAVTVTP